MEKYMYLSMKLIVSFILASILVKISGVQNTNSKVFILSILMFLFCVLMIIGEYIYYFISNRYIRKFKKDFYSAGELKGKSICDSRFSFNASFEKDKELFQNLADRSLRNVSLPEEDYSIYNFSNIYLVDACFTKDSILPCDSEFFQNLRYKSIRGITLPEGDYRKYNFNGVKICEAKFKENSRLTDKNDFFQKIDKKDISEVILPSYEVRSFHLYNLDGIRLGKNFRVKNSLNKYQRLIIYNKGIVDRNYMF